MMGDVPALGSHSRKILTDLDFSPKEIDELVAAGVTTA
jgi:crotonobetainyl-CoA:carnitine CoA-transferase CaiB-like acyl-CoA transferase